MRTFWYERKFGCVPLMHNLLYAYNMNLKTCEVNKVMYVAEFIREILWYDSIRIFMKSVERPELAREYQL